MKESVKLHMICISCINDRHPVPKNTWSRNFTYHSVSERNFT